MKSVRFTKVVEVAGKPEPYTLWQDPDKEPEFQKAIHDQRVMTVIRDPASSKADVATVGYLKKTGALYLLFPKTLKEFQDQRIVGLKYDLLTESKPRGRSIETAKPKKPVPRPAPTPRVNIIETEAEPPPARAQRQEPPGPKPPPKFRVRAHVIATVETELEIEAKNKDDARKAAAEQLEKEPVDFTVAKRQVKVTDISKTEE